MTNWVFSAGGQWTEGQGNLHENGGLTQVDGFGPAPVQFATDDSRLFQKYSASARWYPAARTSIDFGGYYKINPYNYNFTQDHHAEQCRAPGEVYPGFLVYQGFETLDGSVRLSLHPWNKVMLVSRYEYQTSTIRTEPDSASGLCHGGSLADAHPQFRPERELDAAGLAVPAGRIQLRRQRNQNAGFRLHPGHPQFAKQLLDGQFQFQFCARTKRPT